MSSRAEPDHPLLPTADAEHVSSQPPPHSPCNSFVYFAGVTKRPSDRPSDRATERPINRSIDGPIDRGIDRPAGRSVDRRIDRNNWAGEGVGAKPGLRKCEITERTEI